jgi:thiol-disulfide isomerase/thioredoxin
VFDRTHLLVVVLALGGACAGLFAGMWLRPSTPQPTASSSMIVVGTPRPGDELPDVDGRTQSIAQWDGKLVLLNFWASWCAPCIEEMPLLDRIQARLGPRGLQVIGIAADAAAPTHAFLRQHPVGYPILVDDPEKSRNGRDVSAIYGNDRSVLPYSVLIGRDGHILAQRFGNFSEESLQQWLAPHL